MPLPSVALTSGVMVIALAVLVPVRARADDRVEVIVIHTRDEPPTPAAANPTPPSPSAPIPPPEDTAKTWLGVQVGLVTMPLSRSSMEIGKRVNGNSMRSCFHVSGRNVCTPMRGPDVRFTFFRTRPGERFPRLIGYVRTGYTTGQGTFEPQSPAGRVHGEPTAMSYVALPVFAGIHAYALQAFPIRPFVGCGAGVDLLRLHYDREADHSIDRITARLGAEVHGGVEARLRTGVSFSIEARQQWGQRLSIAGVPAFSNTGFSLIASIGISIPTRAQPRLGAA